MSRSSIYFVNVKLDTDKMFSRRKPLLIIISDIPVLILGSSREVKAPAEVSEQMVQKLRGKNEFTVLVTLKQDHLSSGVILSIHHSEHRYDHSTFHHNLCKTACVMRK